MLGKYGLYDVIPFILMSIKYLTCFMKASHSSSKVLKFRGSPVLKPSFLPVRGSMPSFKVISSILGKLKYPVKMYDSFPKAPVSTHPLYACCAGILQGFALP